MSDSPRSCQSTRPHARLSRNSRGWQLPWWLPWCGGYPGGNCARQGSGISTQAHDRRYTAHRGTEVWVINTSPLIILDRLGWGGWGREPCNGSAGAVDGVASDAWASTTARYGPAGGARACKGAGLAQPHRPLFARPPLPFGAKRSGRCCGPFCVRPDFSDSEAELGARADGSDPTGRMEALCERSERMPADIRVHHGRA